jgi:hypothetical protein
MFILVLGLSAGFAYSQRVFRQAQLSSMAQNLLDLQIEDLRSLSPATLHHLVEGAEDSALVNYPHYLASDAQSAAIHPTATQYFYDQKDDTDAATKGVFYMVNLIDMVEGLDGTEYSAPAAIPSANVLLGSNVSVQLVTPPFPASPYYNVVFFHDMYPTLARRIRISEIPAGNNKYAYEYSVAILSRVSNSDPYEVLQELSGVFTPLATLSGGT